MRDRRKKPTTHSSGCQKSTRRPPAVSHAIGPVLIIFAHEHMQHSIAISNVCVCVCAALAPRSGAVQCERCSTPATHLRGVRNNSPDRERMHDGQSTRLDRKYSFLKSVESVHVTD